MYQQSPSFRKQHTSTYSHLLSENNTQAHTLTFFQKTTHKHIAHTLTFFQKTTHKHIAPSVFSTVIDYHITSKLIGKYGYN